MEFCSRIAFREELRKAFIQSFSVMASASPKRTPERMVSRSSTDMVFSRRRTAAVARSSKRSATLSSRCKRPSSTRSPTARAVTLLQAEKVCLGAVRTWLS